MVNKGGSRVAVATDGDALVNAIGMNGADVVELIAHASGPGDVRDVARAIEAAADDVIHHAACISDPETARLDTTHCGGADDGDTLNYMVDILIRLMNGDRRRWVFFTFSFAVFMMFLVKFSGMPSAMIAIVFKDEQFMASMVTL